MLCSLNEWETPQKDMEGGLLDREETEGAGIQVGLVVAVHL